MAEFEYVNLEGHFARMVEATKLLNQINEDAKHMRWQGLDRDAAFTDLVDAIDDAKSGWIASNC